MDTKYLVCIQIETPEKVWNRSVIVSYLPKQEDIEYYYKNLCSLQATITFEYEVIPQAFNEELLKAIQTITSSLPRNDIETEPHDVGKRSEYKKLMKNICEMERGRVNLFLPKAKESVQKAKEDDEDAPKLSYQRRWAQEILQSLHGSETKETKETNEINTVHEGAPVFGWILTPSSPYIRETIGSRFLLDSVLGKKWEMLLGTDLYPDLLLRRRISIQSWSFQQTISETLLKTTLDWYLAAKHTTIVGGLSDWILDADIEFSSLLTSFCRIKVHESVMKVTEDTSKVIQILSIIENMYLGTSNDEVTIHPIPAESFKRYMNYVFLYLRIPKEQYWGLTKLQDIYARWEHNAMGFLPDKSPYIENWSEMWNMAIGGNPTKDRVLLFLQTLDAWDPIESILIPNTSKTKLTKEWVKLYIKSEMLLDKSSSVRSAILHEKVKKWCCKFLPEQVFETKLSPEVVGPVFTKQGFPTKKRKGGRWTNGLVFREEPVEVMKSEQSIVLRSDQPCDNEIHLGNI